VQIDAGAPHASDAHRRVLEGLLQRIEADASEIAIVSLALRTDPAGSAHLVAGSVLMGPARMAELSWPEWASADNPDQRAIDLSVYGLDAAEWRAFDVELEEWRLVRAALPLPQALDWLAELLARGKATLPLALTVFAELGTADSLFHLFQHVTTPAGKLAVMAGRPIIGWLHPVGQRPGAPTLPPPSHWRAVTGHPPFSGLSYLLGLSLEGQRGTGVAQGLLVARLQRDAWIAGLRGGRPDLETFDVILRLEPSRVALWELVIDLEELDGTGALLAARRVPLADLHLPDHGAESVTVRLPTVGRRLTRRLRLYNRQGRLLDAADDVILAEQISIALTVNDIPDRTITVGDNATPSLIDRLEALDRSEQQHVELLEAGMPQRVVVNGQDGRRVLSSRLAAARNELLVYDPYFGMDPTDWELFRDVDVPVRLLTSADVAVPAATGRGRALSARRWTERKTPFHDRGYLWSDGGLSVGTSPNGLGNRVTIIDPLEPSVAARMTQLFESWWSDSKAQPLPAP